MSFTYSDTGFKTAFDNAWSSYEDIYKNPSAYGYNQYKSTVDDLFDQVMNHGDFSYDMEKDQLFQMYKQQYDRKGQRAMKNQMGISAANSGGYNSSVAQTSAQNVYQTYMDELSQKASETYQNAYDMFNQDFNNLMNKYNMASDMNNAGNKAYNDQLTQKSTMAQNAYNAYQDDKNMQYNQYSDNLVYQQNEEKNKQDQSNWQKDYDWRKNNS